MNRKHLGIVIVIFFGLVLMAFITLIWNTIENKRESARAIVQMPELTMNAISGNVVDVTDSDFNILVHFDSGCDHCQNQVADFYKNRKLFVKTNLIFISTEDSLSIQAFASTFFPGSFSNVEFTKIDQKLLYQAFGEVKSPHIFIYDHSNRLIKEIKGEIKCEKILEVLNSLNRD